MPNAKCTRKRCIHMHIRSNIYFTSNYQNNLLSQKFVPEGFRLSTHRGRVTHTCIDKLAIIGSDHSLWPSQCQAIIWTNAGILLIRTTWTNFSEILGVNQTFSFKKMQVKMSSAKGRQFCLGFNVLMTAKWPQTHSIHMTLVLQTTVGSVSIYSKKDRGDGSAA